MDHEADDEQEDAMLDPDEADEEITNNNEDAHMDSDPEDEYDASNNEIQLQNDSVAHFDSHKDSIFCIAQHPIHPELIATGGGDDVGYVFDCTPALQQQATSNGTTSHPMQGESLPPLFKLQGHTDSINAITFTLPHGEYVLTAGLDGQVRGWHDNPSPLGHKWSYITSAQEVEEINFLIPCPNPDHPNTVALGASDGSVWIYSISDASLDIVQAFYLHTTPCTAGAWTPDGKRLATVSAGGDLYMWDVFGEAAALAQGGHTVVALTALDERFKVEGGLYCVAVAPNGAFVAVGGADGQIRIVGLPRVGATAAQAGRILASLQTQKDSVETIAFAAPPLTLMAAGSVDGSVVLFDTAHRFAVRRHIQGAHEEEAVIKVEFGGGEAGNWVLTSCGNDGVVRRWDTRGGTAAAGQGCLGEWKGHRGAGDGGGVLGFVQRGYGGRWIVTAGDE